MTIYATYLAFSIQVIERKTATQNVPHKFEFSCYHGENNRKRLFIETLPFRHDEEEFKPVDFYFQNIGSRRKVKFVICESFYEAKRLNNLADIFFVINSWVSNYIRDTNYIRKDEITVIAHLYGITSQKSENIHVTAIREDQQFALYPIVNSNKSNPAVYLENNQAKDTRNNLELKVTEDFFRNKNLIGVSDIDRAVQSVGAWMHLYMQVMYESKVELPNKVCNI